MKGQLQFFVIHKQSLRLLNIVSIIVLVLSSCRTQKQLQYLQGVIDTATLGQISIPEPVIQKGDLIGITIFSDNAEASATFNQQMTGAMSSELTSMGAATSGVTGVSGQNMPGYLVDEQGFIRLQSVGLIKAEGLTKAQLTKNLEDKLVNFLKNPYCNIRFLNYKFTILGEVSKQGVYTIPGEKINILEAIGMAGDMTIYGLKDSIIVIREQNNRRSFGSVNVSDPNILLSPYYYLRQNDIVVIKASPKKPGVSEQTNARNLALIATFATIITSITVLLNVLIK